MTQEKSNPRPEYRDIEERAEIPEISDLVIEKFRLAIRPDTRHSWFPSQGGQVHLENSSWAARIRNEANANLHFLGGKIANETKDLLLQRYKQELNEQIACLRQYNAGVVPMTAFDLDFEEAPPTQESWIRETLYFHMKYGDRLEELFFDEEIEGSRLGYDRGILGLRYDILTENGTWEQSRKALGKLMALEPTENYKPFFANPSFVAGLKTLVDHFGIPSSYLRQDQEKTSNAYNLLMEPSEEEEDDDR